MAKIKLLYIFLICVLFYLSPELAKAQLTGSIRDTSGDPLPYASIHIKGTSKGTFSSETGKYELSLLPKENILVFKYVGYASKEIKVFNNGSPTIKDVILENDNVILNTVVITPDAEDPAYAIIRKAIKARKNFKDKPLNYKSRNYQKFQFELLSVPDKIMGMTVATTEEDKKEIEELVDSSSNVMYVTEIVSDLYKGNKGESKEIVISSRISGDNSSYSALSSNFSKLDFYDNTIYLGRKLVSPIAQNALLFYKYELTGTFFDENGHLINKIKVIPKGKHDPVFNGYVFIVEDLWNLYGLELNLTADNTNIMFVDSITIKKFYRELSAENTWVPETQYATFTIGVLGFKAKGFHTKNIVNYEMNQNFEDDFFGRIRMEVQRESNKRDSLYWENVRPIPLTVKEKRAYIKMDSIALVTTSKTYLDSTDRLNNKFSYSDLWGSYNYRNSFKGYKFKIGSPLFNISFNPVQGFYSHMNFTFQKQLKRKNDLTVDLKLEYGLANKLLNPVLSFRHTLDNRNKFVHELSMGRKLTQPGEIEIMSSAINAETCLFLGKNYISLYQKEFIQYKIRRHFIPGMNAELDLSYQHRTASQNNTDFMFRELEPYKPNIYEDTDELVYRNKLSLALKISYRPGTTYKSMPDELIQMYFNKPLFYLEYTKSIGVNENFVSSDLIKGGMKGRLSSGYFGTTSYELELGKFLSNKRVDQIDDQYFIGNELSYLISYQYQNAYHLLPHYPRAEFRNFGSIKMNHTFNGLLLGKIPLIRKLKVQEVLNVNVLYLDQEKLYYEFGAGINGLFRLANLRYSWGFNGKEFYNKRFTFSLNIPI